jgi:type IV conjugative transfer system coupling protein TraD
MSVIRRSHLSDFTRGGQTTLHFLRMIAQVFQKFGVFVIVCYVGFVGVVFMLNTTAYERYVSLKWVISKAAVEVLDNGDSAVPFELPDGRTVQVRIKLLLADQYIHETVQRQLRVISRGVAWGMVALGLALFFLIGFITRTGFALRTDQFLRGGNLVEAQDLAKQLKRANKASDLQIAGIPLVGGSETSHLLITGSPGSGKSLAIRELLDGIRRRGERAIVYSTAGEFIEHYYRAGGRDLILNPLDARCPAWNIWAEGHTPADFDNIAASLIPESQGGHDPFWNLAARTLFSTLAMRMKRNDNHSTAQLLRDLLTINLEEAAELVKGTETAAIIAQGAEKTALSVRSTLAAYIRSLKFLRSEGDVFSIRDWVHEDQGEGWIFIASRPDQKETLRPLITLWLDIATSAILSLKPDRNRRIWIIIDELPSLNKLPSLPELLAQGRKFGACTIEIEAHVHNRKPLICRGS